MMKFLVDELKLQKEQAVDLKSITKNGHNMKRKFEELG